MSDIIRVTLTITGLLVWLSIGIGFVFWILLFAVPEVWEAFCRSCYLAFATAEQKRAIREGVARKVKM